MNQALNPSESGKLIVQVRTADGSIPVEGATVSVISYENDMSEVLAVLTTDDSGSTPIISVKTPPLKNSLSPGNDKGYTTLIIQINKDGYVPDQFIGATVFPGVTSVQPVNLVPLPEYTTERDNTNYFETGGYSLE